MAGMNQLANRLLLALNQAGVDISLEKRTFWSRAYHKVLTKYTVRERDEETGRREKLLATYRLSEVVLLLAERYQEINGE